MIMSRTPMRISFSGGGTDLADFYKQETGAVLSTTINKYMYVIVNHRFDDGFRLAYSEVEEAERASQIKNNMIRECVQYFGISSMDISSLADIPAATGLGSSSAYLVGLLNALSYSRSEYMSKEALAKVACKIEIESLGHHIGKQDAYSSAYGNLNLIEFHPDETVEIKPVLCSPETRDELNRSLMLFYLGKKEKRSGEVLSTWDFEMGVETLREMSDLAYEMKIALEKGTTLSDFGLLLGESWKLKKRLSSEISTPEVDEIYDRALGAGALSGKLCGSGGNGFLLLFCEGQNKQKVRESLSPIREVAFRFDPVGSQISYMG